MEAVTLQVDCKRIYEFRKANPGYIGERALMHVGCGRLMVCTVRWAAGLADGNLAPMFLHEFGHIGNGYTEPAANGWVLRNFGIKIEYRGPLDLQWLPPLTVRRILAAHSSSPSS
jgi:hypothetical protein